MRCWMAWCWAPPQPGSAGTLGVFLSETVAGFASEGATTGGGEGAAKIVLVGGSGTGNRVSTTTGFGVTFSIGRSASHARTKAASTCALGVPYFSLEAVDRKR